MRAKPSAAASGFGIPSKLSISDVKPFATTSGFGVPTKIGFGSTAAGMGTQSSGFQVFGQSAGVAGLSFNSLASSPAAEKGFGVSTTSASVDGAKQMFGQPSAFTTPISKGLTIPKTPSSASNITVG